MDITLQSRSYSSGRIYSIGVVIPTFNRSDTIILCLEHLEKQTWTDFEVIIVDDGSTDSTPQLLKEYLRSSELHVRYVHQVNSGASRARNAAIAVLHAPVCLMIGDDILLSPDAVGIHFNAHQKKPDLNVACLGLTRWSNSGQIVTKFMRWLEESGNQFAYTDLLDGVKADWRHFYTSNLSLKTDFLRQNPFNESFSKYGMEDIELGYRLEVLHALKVVFRPEALGHHLHPTTFKRACKRQLNIGASNRLFHELWPDSQIRPSSTLKRLFRKVVARNSWLLPPITFVADLFTRVWCPNPFMYVALSSCYSFGYENSPYRSSKSCESAKPKM